MVILGLAGNRTEKGETMERQMRVGQRVRMTGRGWTHGRTGVVVEVGGSSVVVEVEGERWGGVEGVEGSGSGQRQSVRMHGRHVEVVR
jgi:hypothetical protein